MNGALESALEDAFLLSRSWRSSSLVCFSGFRNVGFLCVGQVRRRD